MKFLITYAIEYPGGSTHLAYVIEDDPVEWITETQDYPEKYFLINTQQVTDEWAEKWDGALKGM